MRERVEQQQSIPNIQSYIQNNEVSKTSAQHEEIRCVSESSNSGAPPNVKSYISYNEVSKTCAQHVAIRCVSESSNSGASPI